MLKYSIFLALSIISFTSFGQSIKYNLKMPKPQNHYFNIEMQLDGFKEKVLEVKMPVWSPGSYLAREFAKNVNLVKAYGDNNTPLEVKKTDKNTWKVIKGKSKNVTVKYEVYAFELSVRTSFLDLTHGFVSGPSVFMYVANHKDEAGSLTIFPYKDFSVITTPLIPVKESVAGDGSKSYTYNDYDQLVDSPIEIGNQIEFKFNAAGVEHNVGIYGIGNHDIPTLQKDMAKIVESATNVFGQNPNKKYTFIIHNVVSAQGGLEHVNSTVLSVNRWTFSQSKYNDFLSLVAHEYFHLWNVKRIRPIELGPFNYDTENYTSLLWVMEGFTSYYDELLMLRAGYYTQKQYLAKLFNTINYVEGSTGTRVQPVAHASFDAWIKAYRPTENSRNTTMSYYSKGTIIAALLDAKIISKFNGGKGLDDFMQHIYKVYYVKKGRGFSEDEFKKELESFIGEDMTQFYDDYINGTEIPDYKSAFATLGLNVEYIGEPKPNVGLILTESGGKTTVRGIRAGSAAEEAGISVHDEILGCNGLRADRNGLNAFFKTVKVGETISILYSRDRQLYSTDIIVTAYEQPKFAYEIATDESTQGLFDFWLRSDAK